VRPPVDRGRIERFLTELGRRFRGAARIYLAGGASLVMEGIEVHTEDIDIVSEVEPALHGELVRAIRELKDEMAVNVEEAGPGDFIPLPPGHETRAVFVGTFGRIQIYEFDLYSTALSKIARGTEKDLAAVGNLLRLGRIDWSRLEELYRSILPEYGARSLKQDPRRFQESFGELRRRIASA